MIFLGAKIEIFHSFQCALKFKVFGQKLDIWHTVHFLKAYQILMSVKNSIVVKSIFFQTPFKHVNEFGKIPKLLNLKKKKNFNGFEKKAFFSSDHESSCCEVSEVWTEKIVTDQIQLFWVQNSASCLIFKNRVWKKLILRTLIFFYSRIYFWTIL